jgi:hypothetical protein
VNLRVVAPSVAETRTDATVCSIAALPAQS